MNETARDDPIRESLPADGLPSAGQLLVPHFGILHLLVWIAVAAVLLKYNQAVQMIAADPRNPFMSSSLMRIQWAVTAIFAASTIVGVGALVRSRLFGMTGRLQPGHWLVVVMVVSGIFSLAVQPLYRATDGSTGAAARLAGASLVGSAIIATLYTCVAVRLRDTRRWEVALWVHAAVSWFSAATGAMFFLAVILPTGGPFLRWGRWLSSLGIVLAARLVPLSCLVVAPLGDILGRTSRDWVHWLGVAIAWTGWCAGVFFLLYFRFLRN